MRNSLRLGLLFLLVGQFANALTPTYSATCKIADFDASASYHLFSEATVKLTNMQSQSLYRYQNIVYQIRVYNLQTAPKLAGTVELDLIDSSTNTVLAETLTTLTGGAAPAQLLLKVRGYPNIDCQLPQSFQP